MLNMQDFRDTLIEQQIDYRTDKTFYDIERSDGENNESFEIRHERIDLAAERYDLVKRKMIEFRVSRYQDKVIEQTSDERKRKCAGD